LKKLGKAAVMKETTGKRALALNRYAFYTLGMVI
jgi:hypothetical protein